MPNAMAPSAPCVDVWLSPHAMVMPGLRQPELGADDVDDALVARSSGAAQSWMPNSRQLRSSAVGHLLGHQIEERPRAARWSARCDRRSRTCARETRRASRAGAACRTPAGSSLRARDAGRRTAASARSAACARRARSRLCERAFQPWCSSLEYMQMARYRVLLSSCSVFSSASLVLAVASVSPASEGRGSTYHVERVGLPAIDGGYRRT